MTSAQEIPTIETLNEAQARIAPHVHRTPIYTSSLLDRDFSASLMFKCENLQKVGAFKARGASNAVFSLNDEEARNGVATHSSGNHGAALAMAAAKRGIPAHIVMPADASAAKKAAVVAYGATIVECAPTLPEKRR